MNVDNFLKILKVSPKNGRVFNPWYDTDGENDIDSCAPDVRRRQLEAYLSERIGRVRFILMGEALGYQGGHFSGIAMTSERILLGHHLAKGIRPEDVFSSIKPQRTSRPEISPGGFNEPTATIAWEHMLKEGMLPEEFVIWNAFPWHPYDPARGILSNRKPTGRELESALPVLKAFLSLFPEGRVIAVGRVAEAILADAGIECQPVRHPANGGAKRFRKELSAILARS